MKKMKTVKEVCEITGLNRKLLFIYDKEGIVKPTGYKNAGYEGVNKNTGVKINYDGYKLYDDEAVKILQQIAIYEKLNMKRSEIIARFSSKNINKKELLDEQIQMLQEKKKEIEELLVVAEQLKIIGMGGEFLGYFAKADFSELAKNAARWEQSNSYRILKGVLGEIEAEGTEKFEAEVSEVWEQLLLLSEEDIIAEETMYKVKSFLDIVKKYYGFVGWFMTIITAIMTTGGGELIIELDEELNEKQLRNSAKAITTFLEKDMDLLWEDYVEIVKKHYKAIGKDYDDPSAVKLVKDLETLLEDYVGVCSNREYEMFFECMDFFPVMIESKTTLYTLGLMEHYHKNGGDGIENGIS